MRNGQHEQSSYLLSKSGLSTPQEDNHHYSDDDLHGSRKRHTGRKNPL